MLISSFSGQKQAGLPPVNYLFIMNTNHDFLQCTYFGRVHFFRCLLFKTSTLVHSSHLIKIILLNVISKFKLILNDSVL